MSIGSVMAFVQMLNYVTAPMGAMANNYQKRKSAEPLVDNIGNILSTGITVDGNVKKKTVEQGIRMQNVCFSYAPDGEMVLNDINLNFEKGKAYAIVGLSGSGKSTLLNLLGGILPLL